MQDAIRRRQNSFFFPNEKERKFARKRGGGEKEMVGGWREMVFDLFQRYYKLSECSCFLYHTSNHYFYNTFTSIPEKNVTEDLALPVKTSTIAKKKKERKKERKGKKGEKKKIHSCCITILVSERIGVIIQ